MFSRLRTAIRALIYPSRTERELDEELRCHLEQQTEQNLRLGMSPDQARSEALKAFGGVEQAKERSRDARGVRWLEELWQDLRYGVRMLPKNPGFALIAVLSLGLGIGANTAIFTWLKAFYLQPLPAVPASRRLITLHSTLIKSDNSSMDVSYPNYRDYRDRNQVFSGLAAFNIVNFNLVYGEGLPEHIWGSLVSSNYFDVLGVHPALGRFFAPEEERIAHPVAVISYRLWQRRFGADQTLIGKMIQLNKLDFTVIGVTPKGFKGSILGGEFEVWAPSLMYPQISPVGQHLFKRGSHHFLAIGRLKEGVTFERAQKNTEAIAAQLAKDYPETNEGEGAKLFTLVDEPNGAGQMAQWLWVLMAVAGMVLLIACANVANLLLARGVRRSRELGIRLALGAGRGRLIRQMLTESLLLAVIGGAGGAVLALWLSDAISLMLPPMGFPLDFNIEWDYRVSGFALALTFLTVLAVGLIPALRSVRVDPIVSIRNEAGAASLPMLRSRLRSALIVTQIAVSMVSLISAGLFIRNLVAQKKVNLGFDPDRALLVSLDLFPNGYDEKRGAEFYRLIAERVSALPGVESASLSNNVPPTIFGGTDWTHEIEGYAPRPNENMGIEYEVVGTGYFRTMRIPIIEGREFDEADRAGSTPLTIVNETMARRYWPGQSALGKRLRGGGGPWATIIGVARDVKNIDATEPARPWMYYPLAQSYNSEMTLVVRTAGDPLLAFAGVRGAIRALDATLPLSDVMTLETHCGVPLFLDRIVVTYLSAFGLLALGLAAIGLYGVMAYSVAARTREIAIRMALGAQTTDVLKLVIRQGMTLTAIGVVIGSISALGLTQLIRELLFGVSTADPLTFISIALLLIVVALLAAYMPARRAAKVDPMVALRWE